MLSMFETFTQIFMVLYGNAEEISGINYLG